MAERLVDMAGLVVEREPIASAHVVQGDAGAVALPDGLLRVTVRDGARVLHLAPDEWLVIGGDGAIDGGAVTDVSSRALCLRIAGARAAMLLNSACSLDLSDRAFPAGTATRTLFGKVQVVLERDADCFRMQYWRSFESYVVELVKRAAADLP